MSTTTESETGPTTRELLLRLAEGDAGVTAEDLLRAEDAERLAAAAASRAEALAAARAEEDRQQRIRAAEASLPSPDAHARIDKERAVMGRAIDAYVAACRDHDAALSGAWSALALGQLDPLPTGVVAATDGRGIVEVDGATHRRTDPQHGIRAAATEALGRHYPRTAVKLGSS